MSHESPSHLSKNPQGWIIIVLLGVIAALGLAYINKSTGKVAQQEATDTKQEAADKLMQQDATSSSNSLVHKFAPALEMIAIPAGSFEIDKSTTPSADMKIKITLNSFALSKTEVTFAQYDVYATNVGKPKPDDEGWGRGNRPVINVSWEDAVAYTRWLSIKTGNNYRLPSEAEWVYAARAGATTQYSWGDNIDCSKASYAIGGECYYKTGNGDAIGTLPVGSYNPNALGLFDMHGNASEWVRDCYDRYLGSSNNVDFDENGRAKENCPVSGSEYHVVRGGSWSSTPYQLTFASRSEFSSGDALSFRIAQDI